MSGGDDGAVATATAAEPDAGSGVISACIPHTSFIAVEFPGYVRNVDRATRMLGGEDGIAAALSSSSSQAASFLKLSFRPDDPTAHPLFGDHNSTRALVLRVSRKRLQPGQADNPSPSHGAETTAAPPPRVQIVAQVSSVYRFTGMADYQFLPLDPGRLDRYKTSPEGQEQQLPVPPENFAASAEPSGAAESMLVVPPVFAQSDIPMEYAFKQYKYQAPGTKGAGKASVQEVGFHIQTVPQPADNAAAAAPAAAAAGAGSSAGDVAGTEKLPLSAAAEKLQSRLTVLLAERPIWSLELLTARLHEGDVVAPVAQSEPGAGAAGAGAAGAGAAGAAEAEAAAAEAGVAGAASAGAATTGDVAVTAATAGGAAAAAAGAAAGATVTGGQGSGKGRSKGAADVGTSQLQSCLVHATYCFKAGPWRHLYIRRGYDPRQDPDSRRYQVLEYKLPVMWFQQLALARAAAQKLEAQAAAAGASEPVAPEGSPAPAAAAGAEQQGQQQQQQRRCQLERVVRFLELPTSSTTELQLCDLEDDVVRRLLAGPASDRCTEEEGWLRKEAAAQMQAAIDARFQQLIDKLSVSVQPSAAAVKAPRKGGRKGKKGAAATSVTEAEQTEAAPMDLDLDLEAAPTEAVTPAGPGAAGAGAGAVTPEAGGSHGVAAAAPSPAEAPSGAAAQGGAAEAHPRSFLSTLMEQMALQPSAAQDKDDDEGNDDDGYKILDSGNEGDDEERGAGFVVPSGDTGLIPPLAQPVPSLSPLARPGQPATFPVDMQVDGEDEGEEEEEEEVEYYDEDAEDDEQYYLGH